MTSSFLFKDTSHSRHSVHTHTHTRTHTHLCLRFYSTEDRENKILPPSTSTHTSPAGRGLLLNSSCQQFPTVSQTLHFSQNYCTDRHCGYNLSTGRVARERGKYKSLILSHKCTRAHMILMLTGRRVCRLHTHALTQTIRNIKCFKKYR